ncbi:flagellar filament capping protein FliD [Aeromonas caviae]
MAGVQAAGMFGSGLPLEQIIQSSVDSKRAVKYQQFTKQEAVLKTSLSGVGQLKSALSTFLTAAKKLNESETFGVRAATVKQPEGGDILSIKTSSKSTEGNYNIVVNNLASGSSLQSSAGAFSSGDQVVATAAGQLTFGAGAKSFVVDVEAGETLATLRGKINEASDNFGLSVNIINTGSDARLVMTSKVTGTGNDLSISANTAELGVFSTTDPASKLVSVTSAADASITVDGLNATSATNSFDNVVQDLEISLLKVSPEVGGIKQGATVTVTTDTSKVESNIKDFVKAYNSLMDSMESLGKRPAIIGTERVGTPGPLAGDSTLNSIQSQLFSTLSSSFTQAGTLNSLFDIGVTMDNKGRLEVKNSGAHNLGEALKNNFDDVGKLFMGDEGLGKKLESLIEPYIKSGGDLTEREDQANIGLRQISQKKSDFDVQMTKYEASLRAKYGKLDSLLVSMQQASSSLQSQLASLM